jgi:hypothetical protein
MSLSNYPSSIDTFTTHTDSPSEIIAASHINKPQDCIVAIENELDTHKALTITAHGGISADYDGDFLSFVEKNYKDINLAYTYTSGLLTGVTITGDVTATITYTYSNGLLHAEVVVVTSPYTKTITTIYTYSSGLLTNEERVTS